MWFAPRSVFARLSEDIDPERRFLRLVTDIHFTVREEDRPIHKLELKDQRWSRTALGCHPEVSKFSKRILKAPYQENMVATACHHARPTI